MAVFTFCVLGRKYHFWTNLLLKDKTVSLSWNLMTSLIRICRIYWYCSLFPFSTGNTLFWANLVQKTKIASLRWNFTHRLIRTCRIQRWRSLFIFRPEILFLGKFGPKNEDYHSKLKLVTQNNPNMQNSIAMFALSLSDWKYSFSANLVQKVKIVSLSWNLVAGLI